MKVAIITARGGSKRIPRKNIKNFLSKPIIAYSIEAALQSGLFDEVMVSTDDNEIGQIASKYGASIPFMRSPETADDYAGTVDVLLEVLKEYKARGKDFTSGCCIYPTAPFVTTDKLRQGLEHLEQNDYDTVFPVVRFGFPIWRSLKKIGGKVEANWPEYYTSRSQDLTPAYHDAGQFYWFNSEALFAYKRLLTPNTGGLEVAANSVQDIDTEEDWQLAELKYQLMRQQGLI